MAPDSTTLRGWKRLIQPAGIAREVIDQLGMVLDDRGSPEEDLRVDRVDDLNQPAVLAGIDDQRIALLASDGLATTEKATASGISPQSRMGAGGPDRPDMT